MYVSWGFPSFYYFNFRAIYYYAPTKFPLNSKHTPPSLIHTYLQDSNKEASRLLPPNSRHSTHSLRNTLLYHILHDEKCFTFRPITRVWPPPWIIIIILSLYRQIPIYTKLDMHINTHFKTKTPIHVHTYTHSFTKITHTHMYIHIHGIYTIFNKNSKIKLNFGEES